MLVRFGVLVIIHALSQINIRWSELVLLILLLPKSKLISGFIFLQTHLFAKSGPRWKSTLISTNLLLDKYFSRRVISHFASLFAADEAI